MNFQVSYPIARADLEILWCDADNDSTCDDYRNFLIAMHHRRLSCVKITTTTSNEGVVLGGENVLLSKRAATSCIYGERRKCFLHVL